MNDDMRTLGEEGIPALVLTLASATCKLRHAADNGEYSAMIRPAEARALLDRLEELETDAVVLEFPQRYSWKV